MVGHVRPDTHQLLVRIGHVAGQLGHAHAHARRREAGAGRLDAQPHQEFEMVVRQVRLHAASDGFGERVATQPVLLRTRLDGAQKFLDVASLPVQ